MLPKELYLDDTSHHIEEVLNIEIDVNVARARLIWKALQEYQCEITTINSCEYMRSVRPLV